MSAHTPGPWTLETVQTTCGVCHKIGPFPWKLDKQNHACIYVNYPNHDNRGQFEDELTANARLIAAAPDLLAKVQEFAEACAQCDGTGITPYHAREAAAGDPCPDCADIRAVIAKATQP